MSLAGYFLAMSSDPTYLRLVKSPLYQTYKKAFRDATGLSVALIPVDEETPLAETENLFHNPFCEKLNAQSNGCRNCQLANRCLHDPTSTNTITCLAKMRETSIPIRCGEKTVAYLVTGQVFTDQPDVKDFQVAVDILGKTMLDTAPLDEMKTHWLDTATFSNEQYFGAITLLAAFGLQLSELLNRILVENETSEPEAIVTAKRFINSNLEEKITLESVAEHVGVSSYYFCKLFKQHVGMTMTEYINRRRVEWAKRKLMDPRSRVTEIAFDVGYQSLSQFNRSFAKYVGMSPTKYRENLSSKRYAAADAMA